MPLSRLLAQRSRDIQFQPVGELKKPAIPQAATASPAFFLCILGDSAVSLS
jgi:hypothetical protein